MVERIGFDARAAFLDPHRGLGRVTASLAAALLDMAGPRIVLFVPHDASVPPAWYTAGAAIVRLRRPKRGAFLFDAAAWRFTLARHPVDVLHLPAWGVPRGLPVAVVATFCDATPFRFPSPAAAWPRLRARRGIRSVSRADLVHAISAAAASELLKFTPTSPERIRVVHLGVGPPFAPAAEDGERRHLLFVGGSDPHKNLGLLLRMLRADSAAALPPLAVPLLVDNSARLYGFA